MISALTPSIRSRWQTLSQTQFFHLLRHCIDRIFYGGEGTEPNEVDFGIGTLLAVLAAPGAFASLALSSKYGTFFLWYRSFSLGSRGGLQFDPYIASLPDEYFFIVLSIVVAGSVAIWKWASLIPDRRDFANLAHLPISNKSFFIANLFALLILVGILSLDINVGSSVLFPLLACASRPALRYTAVFFATHALSVVLAAAFGFFSVLALLGILMSLLPYRAFKKSSVYVRSILLIFCTALLTTAFSEPRKMQNLRHIRSWARFPPPAWFAALCQSIRGVGNPQLLSLGRAAIVMSVCAPVLAVGAYAMSYRRCFLRSAETMVTIPAGGGLVAPTVLRLFDKLTLRGPVQRAGYRFVMKTLFRSETHSLTWIGFAAIGIILVVQTILATLARGATIPAIPTAALLGVPLVLTYFLMFGLRLAFEIPVTLRANWAFRLGVDPLTHQYSGLARKVILTFEIPLIVACLGVYGHFWGWQIALLHTGIVAAMSVLLMETLLLQFRKIPFTCSAPPFKSNAILNISICVLGYFAFSSVAPALERQALDYPFPFAELILIFLLAWCACLYALRNNLTEIERRLIFEDRPAPAVETMDLTFRR